MFDTGDKSLRPLMSKLNSLKSRFSSNSGNDMSAGFQEEVLSSGNKTKSSIALLPSDNRSGGDACDKDGTDTGGLGFGRLEEVVEVEDLDISVCCRRCEGSHWRQH